MNKSPEVDPEETKIMDEKQLNELRSLSSMPPPRALAQPAKKRDRLTPEPPEAA